MYFPLSVFATACLLSHKTKVFQEQLQMQRAIPLNLQTSVLIKPLLQSTALQMEVSLDVEGTSIFAGKKTEVINISNANVNASLKTGRELFAKVPEIFVYDMDGSGNQVNISNRGLDPHRSWEYNVRQNGINTNSDMYGYPASHYSAPMESIEKVELIHGTGSLQYGAQFGGLINYFTKTADTSKVINFESVSTVGSFGLSSNYVSLGGKKGKWMYNAYISKRDAKGYRNNSESNADGHFVSIQYKASSKLSIKAECGHSTYLYHIPGPLTDAMFAQNPRQATRSRNYFSPDIYVPSLSLNWNISEKTQLRFTSSAVLGTRNSVQFIGFADKLDVIDPATNNYKARQVDIDRFNSYTNELRMKHIYHIGKINAVLVGGIQSMNNDLHRCQQGKGTSGSAYDLTLSVPGWGRDLHFKTNNIAVFAENMFCFSPKFSVSPGIRYENGITHLSGSISYYNPEKTPLAIQHKFPLFGLSTQYKFNDNNRFYAGVSQAYRPMIFKDVIPASAIEQIDPHLKDAYGVNIEAGFRGKLKSLISYDITYFYIEYNKRIGGMVQKDAAGNYYNYKTNIGNSITDGVEAYIEAAVIKNPKHFELSFFTSTAYMNGRYIKGTVTVNNINTSIIRHKLEAVPEWTSRNGINLAYKTFTANLQYSYVSATFSDALNTKTPALNGSIGPVTAYGLFDFGASYKFLKYYRLKAGINNIADTHYFTKRPTFYPDPGIWPSDGRSFYVTLSCKI